MEDRWDFNARTTREFIDIPIIWNVNCCGKRHKIALKPNGTLSFLDHPTRRSWKRVHAVEAMNRSAGEQGYAVRCLAVRTAWKLALSASGNMSDLPGSKGVSWKRGEDYVVTNPGTTTLKLREILTKEDYQKAIEFWGCDAFEVGPTLGEPIEAYSMREVADLLRNWGRIRRKKYRKLSKYDVERPYHAAQRTIKSDAIVRRKERIQCGDLLLGSKKYTSDQALTDQMKRRPLFLNKIRELRNLQICDDEGFGRRIGLVLADPKDEEMYLSAIKSGGKGFGYQIRIVFFLTNYYGTLELKVPQGSPRIIWGWAERHGQSWIITEDNTDIFYICKALGEK